jgi:cytochrome c553
MKVSRSFLTRVAASALTLLFLATPWTAAQAGDAKVGAGLAEKCVACHGLDGLSKIVEAPNIAGQNEQYLVKQLNAFKSGERKNEMMSVVAPTLSDKDIEDLASYYSAIEITVGKLPAK